MAVIVGLDPSYNHADNGMTKADMRACKQVADRHNEVIIFRSTGPWSKRWIEKGYPTKNFHVKGKSSDWGPQAGLVPYDGYFSKVGHKYGEGRQGHRGQDHLRRQARSDGRYDIKTFGGSMKSTNIYVVLDKIKTGKSLKALEVMTSNEVGAHEPMTGDYDLFAVCPSWADYGSGAPTKIHKPGLVM